METRYSLAEVAKHNTPTDCWIIIANQVYNVTSFILLHPGGRHALLQAAGKDASIDFYSVHGPLVLSKYQKFKCGTLDQPTTKIESSVAMVYSEPYWYLPSFKSPYYNASHHDFRKKVRKFVDAELTPFVHGWDEAGTYPPELHQKAYDAGLYAAIWPKEYGGTPPPDFDVFHDLILVDELSRCAAGGILWACFFSFGIALPPILAVGSQYLKDKVARDIITGKKICSLAVTEPYGGSDVASLRTTAVLTPDKQHYVVNGTKKFITSGMKADYFTTAVRTGGPGVGGVSLLLLEKDMPGLSMRRQKTQGWLISNTAFLIFDNVKVPVANLIGIENQGFSSIMHNFNHERFVLAAMANRYARVCIEEAIRYGRVRATFNKRLVDHQVIRHKIAEMARHVESTHALIEQTAYQLKMGIPAEKIGGVIALLKVQATKTMELAARESSQIFGGASYIRGGQGEKVERLYREVRVNAIGGGSEEVLLDLSMKMAKL